MTWVFHSLIALVLYGFWAFFPKLVAIHISPKDAIIIESIAIALFGLIFWFFYKEHFQYNFHGVLYSALTGITGMVGTLFFLYALSKGKASVIVTITALYPLVTIFLSLIFLKETVSIRQLVGILLAIIAMYLMASK